jgi:uncharacterized protein YrrD
MPRGSDLIGLPVHLGPTIKRIGSIQDAVLTGDLTTVAGLLLSRGGLFRRRRILAYRAVRALRPTHLLAEEIYLDELEGLRTAHDLRGRPVLAADGSEVGLLDDIHFDPASGRVLALQLSHGLVDDLLTGKGIIAMSGPMAVWEEAICFPRPD